jgi:type I restriction enzyme S subunit
MAVKKGYKQTEVGVIPKDWEVVALGRMIRSVEYGSSSKSFTRGAIPVIRMGNLQNGKIDWDDLVYTDNEQEIKRYLLRQGDVLFNRTNTIDLVGKSAIYEGEQPAIFAGYLIRINALPGELNTRFLNYILNTESSRKHSAKVLSIAVGQANINGQKLKTYPIPLPPTLHEQEAIAGALSDADAWIESLEQLIAKKRQIKQGAMQELLTGKRRLPGFSGKWETKRLGDHCRFLRNGTNSRADLSVDGPLRYLHYGDIHSCNNVYLSPNLLPSLPMSKANTLDRLQDGDLVLADASEDTIGISKSVEIVGVDSFELVAGLHTIAVRFSVGIFAPSFVGLLQHCPDFNSHLRKLAAGTKVYATNRRHVSSAEVSIPGLAEQTAIATVLSDMDAEIDSLESKLTKAREAKQGMMQELLTGRIRLV